MFFNPITAETAEFTTFELPCNIIGQYDSITRKLAKIRALPYCTGRKDYYEDDYELWGGKRSVNCTFVFTVPNYYADTFWGKIWQFYHADRVNLYAMLPKEIPSEAELVRQKRMERIKEEWWTIKHIFRPIFTNPLIIVPVAYVALMWFCFKMYP